MDERVTAMIREAMPLAALLGFEASSSAAPGRPNAARLRASCTVGT